MTQSPITLRQAIEDLYRRTEVEGAWTSTQRLQNLAEYCVQQLEARGLVGAQIDVIIPGGGRSKQWDVVWEYNRKCRLALSLKSILRNLAGTVPNRIDDLMGEVVNIQMFSPEVVVGYLMIFNVAEDAVSKKHGLTWSEFLKSRLTEIAGRKAPSWSVGMIEAFSVVEVDFSHDARLITAEDEVLRMFDILVEEVRKRNPSVASGGD